MAYVAEIDDLRGHVIYPPKYPHPWDGTGSKLVELAETVARALGNERPGTDSFRRKRKRSPRLAAPEKSMDWGAHAPSRASDRASRPEQRAPTRVETGAVARSEPIDEASIGAREARALPDFRQQELNLALDE